LGKSLLAFLSNERRDESLPVLTFERATPWAISNLARFRKELSRVLQQGYAIDDQETDTGARCVAAPILDESGNVAAAISVSRPITRISRDRIHAFALATKRAARPISAQLGHLR
jgi:IclR family acetate operon transcriptional repressor